MIIIWAIKVRFKRLREVQFACPRCGADRAGDVVEARRWFTLFFIPLIPLKVLGELVQCRTCNGRFDAAVLDAPTAASTSEHLTAAARHGAASMVRVSANSPASRAAAIAVVNDTGLAYDDDQLDIDLGGSSQAQAIGWLQHLAPVLNAYGKESFLTRMTSIALADGRLDEAEQALLESMGVALEMTPAHVSGVLAETAKRARSQG